MTSGSVNPRVAREVAKEGGSVVETFHGVVHLKPSWSNFTYNEPFTITIVRYPDVESLNAQEWATAEISRIAAPREIPESVKAWCARHPHCSADTIAMPKFHELASRSIPVCGGHTGWLNAYTFSGTEENYEHAFVRAGKSMYVAVLEYSNATGDPLHAADSLRTLCPPNAGEVKPVNVAVPFKPPVNWLRSARTGDIMGYTQLGGWYHVPAHSNEAETIVLARISDVSEYTTPEQTAALWIDEGRQSAKAFRLIQNHAENICGGSDNWLSVSRVEDARGTQYVVENMYAYGNDNLYILEYSRSAAIPQDPQAYNALLSLCPAAATPKP
jgi:hypothetical protein